MMMHFVDLHRLCCEVPGAREVMAAGCLRCRDRQWLIGLIKGAGIRHETLGYRNKIPHNESGRRSARRRQIRLSGRGESGSGRNQSGQSARSVKGVISGFFAALFGEAGCCAGECRVGAPEVGLAASLRRTVAFFNAVFGRRMANAAGSDDKAGASPAGRAFSTGWKRLWRGCWIVSWDGSRTRIFWRWGKV